MFYLSAALAVMAMVILGFSFWSIAVRNHKERLGQKIDDLCNELILLEDFLSDLADEGGISLFHQEKRRKLRRKIAKHSRKLFGLIKRDQERLHQRFPRVEAGEIERFITFALENSSRITNISDRTDLQWSVRYWSNRYNAMDDENQPPQADVKLRKAHVAI